jgi:hypothetical protein
VEVNVGIKVLHLLTQLNAKDRFYFVASKVAFMLLRMPSTFADIKKFANGKQTMP